MSHKNKEKLIDQVTNVLLTKMRIGESRHEAKQCGTAAKYIFSWQSYHTYKDSAYKFVQWCYTTHRCRTLDACRQYADEWLQSCSHLSPYTQKTYACALGKLYECPTTDFIPTAKRSRATITRSRGTKKRDSHFSEAKHQDFVNFCKSTGLRRAELKYLCGSDLIFDGGTYYIQITRASKGGRPRMVPIINYTEDVIQRMLACGNERVFQKIPSGADIHSYRADYANMLYRMNARPMDVVPTNDRYYCRKDCKGTHLDKQAMKIVSKALGHNRISIFADNYLRPDSLK